MPAFFNYPRIPENKFIYGVFFLQGLLLMNSEDLPANMRFTVSILKRFEKLVRESGISKQSFALEYVKQSYPEAKDCFSGWKPLNS